MTLIKFGTDGWRAIIGKDFTPENVMQVIQGFADIYPGLNECGREIVIGYDRREKSKESAELAAEVLTGNNIMVNLSSDFCPTPAVSWTIQNSGAAAGIMITASHNPADYNGIKFKESYGGSASPEYLRPIENKIEENITAKRRPKLKRLPNDLLRGFDARKEYAEGLLKFVDIKEILNARFNVLVEPMYGAGCGFFPLFLGSSATELHTAADTTFGGLQPEPIPPHINEAIKLMKEKDYDICLATDGDADRIGLVDEKGGFVDPHKIFSLLLKHLVEHKKWKGTVIKTITTTRMLDHLCKWYGLELKVTPVGFKYISPLLKSPDALMGGEESGGIGIRRHICERDGILCGLLALETMAVRQKPLSALVEELQKEAGPFYYKRRDLRLDREKVSMAHARLSEFKPSKILGKRVVEHKTIDGYYYLLEDESWFLVRGSGTEPLLRIYAEAHSPDEVERLHDEAKKITGLEEV